MNKTTLILTCAGKGERAGKGINKLLVKIDGVSILERAITPFINSRLINQYIITSAVDDVEEISSIAKNLEERFDVKGCISVVVGGETRSKSVKNGLNLLSDGIVLIHDGARPFVSQDIIERVIASVREFGSGVTAIPSPDTVCNGENGEISSYLGKEGIYRVQTPQGFFVRDIKKAYSLVGNENFGDDGEVYKRFVGQPKIVMGSQDNVKITYPEDFARFNDSDVRFGVGFDCHQLVEGRKLILGGIEIAHDKGLLGHSDADVLIHAIMDALLSACAMRDIGYWFSDKNPQYKDANSMHLLEKVLEIIGEKGYKPQSISACIMAEKPKLLNIIPTITTNIAKALSLPLSSVGISATTLEGLGFVGREEGICVHATAVVRK